MPKINTKQKFVNLRGFEIKQEKEFLTLGVVLAEIILAPHEDKDGFRPLKAYELAKKFFDQKEVEIDKADLMQLRELVEKSASYIPLITAQVLEKLDAIKE